MTRRNYTDEQVEFIRSKAVDHTDGQIGELMGWPAWKVLRIRTRHQISTMPGFWIPERIEELRKLLVVEGHSTNVIAKRFGCHGTSVRKAVARYGFVRNPIAAEEDRIESSRRAGLKGGAARWAGHTPTQKPAPAAAAPVRQRRHFGNGAFSPAQPIDREPLGDRILKVLANQQLSAAALATLTGDKEAHVSMQLSALAHAGQVRAGEGGPRERRWSLAA